MNPYLDDGEDEEEKPVKVLPCRSDPDQWFVEATTDKNRELVAAAKRACRTCPAFDACSELAARIRPTHGVWAAKDWGTRPSQTRGGDRITRNHLAGIPKRKAT